MIKNRKVSTNNTNLSNALDKIICPSCHRKSTDNSFKLKIKKNCLMCEKCKTKYNIIYGIPNLIPKEHKNFTIDYYESGDALRLGVDKFDKRWIDPNYKNREEVIFDNYKNIINLIKKKDLKINSVIDVGCANGRQLKMFCSKNPGIKNCCGIDLSMNNLNIAKNHNVDKLFIRADGQLLPFRDDSYDLCLALDVIEHVPNVNICLKEINRVSKYVLIKTPLDKESFYDNIIHYNWKKEDWKQKKGHLHKFSKRSLFKLLEKNGFKVCGYAYFRHQPKRLFRWIKDRKTSLKKLTLFIQTLLCICLPNFIYMRIVPPAIFVLCEHKIRINDLKRVGN